MTVTNIQYKNTHICMDFYCPKCGYHSHFDGYFANAVECRRCKVHFKLATDIQVTELPAGDDTPFITDETEDDDD